MSPRPKNTLSVYPNPFAALGAYGEPAGVCPCDPHEHTPDRRWVGASIASADVHTPRERGDLRSALQDLTYQFELDVPSLIPQTSYYLDCIKQGLLIPADEKTAARAGRPYLSLEEALSASRALAISKWDSFYGQGSCPLSEDL